MFFGFEDITAGYGRREVVKQVTLEVPRGQITVLLGPNGCGKSTLLGTVSGAVTPRGGRVWLDGRPRAAYSPREWARRVAYLAQNAPLPGDIEVRTLVSYGRYPHGRGESAADREAIARALALTELQALADRPLRTLSGGERQRARLAMCLCQGADILLLDEPTTHLDIGHAYDLLTLIRRLNETQGLTVLAVLHDPDAAARLGHRLAMMDGGRLVGVGVASEVLTPALIGRVFGMEATVRCEEGYPRIEVRGRWEDRSQ